MRGLGLLASHCWGCSTTTLTNVQETEPGVWTALPGQTDCIDECDHCGTDLVHFNVTPMGRPSQTARRTSGPDVMKPLAFLALLYVLVVAGLALAAGHTDTADDRYRRLVRQSDDYCPTRAAAVLPDPQRRVHTVGVRCSDGAVVYINDAVLFSDWTATGHGTVR